MHETPGATLVSTESQQVLSVDTRYERTPAHNTSWVAHMRVPPWGKSDVKERPRLEY